MGSTATAQINARIDRDLKEAGDRGLERAGFTPTQAVRALWAAFSEAGPRQDAARKVLLETPEREGQSEETMRRREAVMRFESLQESFFQLLKDAGVDPDTFVPMTDEEMEEARYEYLLEKYGE